MSSTTGLERPGHPIVEFVDVLRRGLDELIDPRVWSLTAAQKRAVLVGLAREEARVAALRLAVLAAADTGDLTGCSDADGDGGGGVAALSGASSAAAWVAGATRQVRSGATGTHADVALAGALDRDRTSTRRGLAAGVVNLEQARVIVRAVTDLPDTVSDLDRERAEAHLVHLAGELDAKALRIAGRRVFEVIDPVVADEREGRRLEREEAAAARETYLQLWDNGDGTHQGRFRLPTLHAMILEKMLAAFTSPRHVSAPRRPAPVRVDGEPAQGRAHRPGSGRRVTGVDIRGVGVGRAASDRAGAASRTARPGVLRAPRADPHRPAPPQRRHQRLGRGPPRLRHPPDRARHRRDRHRPAHLGRRGPTPGLSGRDHPGRHRPWLQRPQRGPRPRSTTATALRTHAPGPGHPRPGLRQHGLRPTRRLVPRPPPPSRGPGAARPAPPTDSSSAPTTTDWPTHPTTGPPPTPTARSPSIAAHDPITC